MAHDELEDRDQAPNPLICGACGRMVDLELPKCAACQKYTCDLCEFRVGGKQYCSRDCGVRYFFWSEDEDGVSED